MGAPHSNPGSAPALLLHRRAVAEPACQPGAGLPAPAHACGCRRQEEARREAFRAAAEAESRRILGEQQAQDAAWRAAVAQARLRKGVPSCSLACLALEPAQQPAASVTAVTLHWLSAEMSKRGCLVGGLLSSLC